RLPWLVVTGEAAVVEKLLPGLTTERWQQSNAAMLLWCGEATALSDEDFACLRRMKGRRAVAALLWASDSLPFDDELALAFPVSSTLQRPDADVHDRVYRQFQRVVKVLSWRPPVYALCLREPTQEEGERPTQAVGVCWQPGNVVDITQQFKEAAPALIQQGMAQLGQDLRWNWLLQLAHDMASAPGQRLASAFQGWLRKHAPLLLSGIYFLPPAGFSQHRQNNACSLPLAWSALTDRRGFPPGQRDHYTLADQCQMALCLLVGMWLVAMGVSAVRNKQLIDESGALRQAVVAVSKQPTAFSLVQQLDRQAALQQQIDQLAWRKMNAVPWSLRFGLSQNNTLLAALWPVWQQHNQHLMLEPLQAQLKQQLQAFVDLPPDSPQRRSAAKSAYQQLKAWLMLAEPERVDAAFLQQVLPPLWSPPAGSTIRPGEWAAQTQQMLAFYVQQLPLHPAWRIPLDDALVAEVRSILRRQQGIQNSETTLYQQVLLGVAKRYPEVTLDTLLGDSAGGPLFSTDDTLPGFFTRQAWEGEIRSAIEKAASARTITSDWVLDASQSASAPPPVLSKEALQARLTERYFDDYSAAWLGFLNSIQWLPSESLSTSIDQLTLLGDARQSPLLALGKVLRYQAGAGQEDEALGDSLIKSAQKLVATPALAGSEAHTRRAPGQVLADTFAPLLAILPPDKSETSAVGANALALNTYLLHVSQVRLQLQQIAGAADPQAMTQGLMKAVFSGNNTTLSQSRQYAQLLAAGLGAEWGGFASAVLVEPMEQAWRGVLQPAQSGLNSAWQNSVQVPWAQEFAGRYPFANTQSEVSFSSLAHYLTPGSGVIDQFVTTQLAGLLEKQGDSWVPNPLNSQGVTFNPAFLDALNQLSLIGRQVFASGQAAMNFDIQIRSAAHIAQTDFQLDDAVIKYFNQMPGWQTFHWPDVGSSQPQMVLSYSAVSAAGDSAQPLDVAFQANGNWALLRLLEKADSEQLDSSRWRLTLKTPTREMLNLILRSQSGAGPLDLLKLRRFKLPAQIFLPHSANTAPEADE
uniref:ImcF-related family protein n=1 Tax=Buttiauxella brennerae TaxID=82988 RepID=UPI00286FA319